MAASDLDTTRLRLGDLIAAISGVVLFVALFLNWYHLDATRTFVHREESYTGVRVFTLIDILLGAIAILAVALAIARMANTFSRSVTNSPGRVLLAAGVLAVLLVLFRLVRLPGEIDPTAQVPGAEVSRSFGIWLALIASLGVTLGGYVNWNEEGRPRLLPGSESRRPRKPMREHEDTTSGREAGVDPPPEAEAEDDPTAQAAETMRAQSRRSSEDPPRGGTAG